LTPAALGPFLADAPGLLSVLANEGERLVR
jgi:hypothetical protein